MVNVLAGVNIVDSDSPASAKRLIEFGESKSNVFCPYRIGKVSS